MDTETDEQQQRLKKRRKWPGWLRSPALLKWSIRLGLIIYRLWRLWASIAGPDN
jgi:hypothetical protein